jgi:cation:H+ antiporter
MFLTLLLFFIGFYILIKGANFLVEGASSLARRLNISSLVIGLVITGIGTSIPEFATSFLANLSDREGIGFGTIIGSNTFNILFILGISALIFPLTFKPVWVERDFIWNIIAVLVVAAFALPFSDGTISRLEGLFMLILFFFWLYRTVHYSESEDSDRVDPPRAIALPLALVLIMSGLLGVILGGKWVVDGAAIMARELGMAEGLVGLTLVGVGTSIPELAVTFVAALKGRPGIAVGNIIGSNIFDFLMILGFGALVSPLMFPPELFFDIIVTVLSAALLYGFMYIGEYFVLKRWQGFLC